MAPPKKWEPPPSHLRKVECRCCGENIILSQYKIDSRELFLDLFKTTEKKYEQIQVILHIVSCAATKVSCESVLETFVSEFEYAINSRKNFSEQGMSETFNIIKNGPPIRFPCVTK